MKNVYKVLAIDTASSYLYLSLIENGKEVETFYEKGNHDHSVTILPEISNLLLKRGYQLNEINEVIVGIGPGSYTGVRIGVSIAKMIGYLNSIPVKTISSLALIASKSDVQGVIVSSIDARRGNSFIASFEQNGLDFQYLIADQLTNTEQFLSQYIDFELVLEGIPKIEKLINNGLLKDVLNIHELVPNYLQITEAERNLNNK